MAVKIRLMRIGAKKRPFYRVVAVDEKRKRTGGYLELLGTYNPLTEPKEIKLKQDRIDEWVKNGAQLSDGFLRIIGQAPQRPARKPKKAQPETADNQNIGKSENQSGGEAEVSETSEPTVETAEQSAAEPENVDQSDNSEASDQSDSSESSEASDSSDQSDNAESKEEETK